MYAEDNGIPEKKRDYCTVAVSIIDINDCPPQFEPVQPMTVKENAPEGTEIGKVTAIDQDTGDNAFIVYNITGNETSTGDHAGGRGLGGMGL